MSRSRRWQGRGPGPLPRPLRTMRPLPVRDSPADHHHYSSQCRATRHLPTHELCPAPMPEPWDSDGPGCWPLDISQGPTAGGRLPGGPQCRASRARGSRAGFPEVATVPSWHKCVWVTVPAQSSGWETQGPPGPQGASVPVRPDPPWPGAGSSPGDLWRTQLRAQAAWERRPGT